jgi:hypothetical protein
MYWGRLLEMNEVRVTRVFYCMTYRLELNCSTAWLAKVKNVFFLGFGATWKFQYIGTMLNESSKL